MFLAFFIDSSEVGIGVLSEQSVEVIVKFLMELVVAVRTQQTCSFNFGRKSMAYHENVVELNNLDREFCAANIASRVLLVEYTLTFLATGSQVFLRVVQRPLLFLLLHLHAPHICVS